MQTKIQTGRKGHFIIKGFFAGFHSNFHRMWKRPGTQLMLEAIIRNTFLPQKETSIIYVKRFFFKKFLKRCHRGEDEI